MKLRHFAVEIQETMEMLEKTLSAGYNCFYWRLMAYC